MTNQFFIDTALALYNKAKPFLLKVKDYLITLWLIGFFLVLFLGNAEAVFNYIIFTALGVFGYLWIKLVNL